MSEQVDGAMKASLWEDLDQDAVVSASIKRLVEILLRTEREYVQEALRPLAMQCSRRLTLMSTLSSTEKNEDFEPVSMGLEILNNPEIASVFNNVEALFLFHSALYHRWMEIILDGNLNELQISDLILQSMLQFLPSFKEYTPYIISSRHSLLNHNMLRASNVPYRQFADVIRKCYKIPIEKLIIVPIHRLPQYLVIFNSIYRCLRDDGDLEIEKDKLYRDALTQLNDMLMEIARSMRDQRNQSASTYSDIFGGASHDLVKPGRYIVKIAEMSRIEPSKMRKPPSKKLFVLFNDCFVYGNRPTKLKGGKISMQVSLDVSGGLKARSILDGTMENIQNAFRLITPKRSIIVIADSPEERDDWVNSIMAAISNFQNRAISRGTDGLDAINENNVVNCGTGNDAFSPADIASGKKPDTWFDSFNPSVLKRATAKFNAENNVAENDHLLSTDSQADLIDKKIRLTMVKYSEFVIGKVFDKDEMAIVHEVRRSSDQSSSDC